LQIVLWTYLFSIYFNWFTSQQISCIASIPIPTISTISAVTNISAVSIASTVKPSLISISELGSWISSRHSKLIIGAILVRSKSKIASQTWSQKYYWFIRACAFPKTVWLWKYDEQEMIRGLWRRGSLQELNFCSVFDQTVFGRRQIFSAFNWVYKYYVLL